MEEKYIDKEEENENRLIKIFIILLLICIILFLVFRNFGFIEHKYQGSNNYIDIFNITFGNECDPCNNKNPSTGDQKPDESNPTPNKPNNNPGVTNPDKEEEPEEEKGFQVFDDDKKYEYETSVNIFRQETEHVVSGKVAPSSQGVYEFIVRNNNDFGINYDIEFNETNASSINMKYRLKANGDYIIGNEYEWVDGTELVSQSSSLQARLQDEYVLEWKWEEDSNDTEIGTNFEANYNLKLKIIAAT